MTLTTMMALGPFRFSIDSGAYQELSNSQSWKWAEQEVVGAYPVLQYTGPEPQAITLKGMIFTAFATGARAQLVAMAAMAGRGQPMLMISAPGLIFGFYVIEKIETNESEFIDTGAPKKVEFTISLKRFADTATAVQMMINNPASIVGFGS